MQVGGHLPETDEALGAGWLSAQQTVDASLRAPLSARLALHAAVLIDRVSDLAFVRRSEVAVPVPNTAGDILAFRSALRDCNPAFGPLMDLTTCGPQSPRLQVIAAAVAPDGFESLAVADLMVSLYNKGMVPRLMLVQHDGSALPMQNLLQAATSWWRATLGDQTVSMAL